MATTAWLGSMEPWSIFLIWATRMRFACQREGFSAAVAAETLSEAFEALAVESWKSMC